MKIGENISQYDDRMPLMLTADAIKLAISYLRSRNVRPFKDGNYRSFIMQDPYFDLLEDRETKIYIVDDPDWYPIELVAFHIRFTMCVEGTPTFETDPSLGAYIIRTHDSCDEYMMWNTEVYGLL